MEQKIRYVLPLVVKPNQYLGNELNGISKKHSEVDLRVVLAYPDSYTIGMSHIGLKILYHILNRRENILAERAYAPWLDMESQMRKRGIPLFSIESHTPLGEFDVLGFTLQYELNFTNLLNMIDLAQIPLRSEERDQTHPLIIAGGTCASNPEPLAEFVDAFVIGDGEEIVEELADLLIRGKKEGWDRPETLIRLAGLEGIYIPSLYRAEYDREGRFQALIALHKSAPHTIRSRVIQRLDLRNYPSHPLVPLTEIAHDRLSIEIMRGCTRGCRYCHAGMVYRPTREKSPEDVLHEIISGIANSGWSEISLVSLSSSDYSCLLPLISEINLLMTDKKVALSLPSMRPDTFSEELARSIMDVHRTGLTFAPEAGTQRLRRVINKSFRKEDILETMRIAFKYGWKSVKLYFMIGLPTETWADLEGIVELGHEVYHLSRKKGRKDLNLSISPFTPKPHTPFQWERQDSIEEFAKKSRYLKSHLPLRGMRVKWRDPHVSFLEGVFTRGDRQLSKVLFLAWQTGCTFDGWTERFKFSRWVAAFSQAGIDPRRYVDQWPLDGPLPWEHISYGVQRQYLERERRKALLGQLTGDCRTGRCHACGVHPEGRKDKSAPEQCHVLQVKDRPAYGRNRKKRAQNRLQIAGSRMRIHYVKKAPLQYLSHLDLIRLFERTIRRADLPIAYTEGFHPHPKIAFGPPLPLGMTSRAEYLDIQFTNPHVGDLASRLRSHLPPGIEIKATNVLFRKTQALTAAINIAEYRAKLSGFNISENFPGVLSDLLTADHLIVKRVTPKETKKVDIRKNILDLRLGGPKGREFLNMRLRIGEAGHVRPQEVLAAVLDLSDEQIKTVPIHRMSLLIERDGQVISPMDDI
ncbi:TIGR03960 family B12-binding radical SAM protein [bacterium]|nr:TIGR03960 family B12-binding radical SAM protein [bacterium]